MVAGRRRRLGGGTKWVNPHSSLVTLPPGVTHQAVTAPAWLRWGRCFKNSPTRDEEMQDLIKNWAAKQNDHPSLAAAVRRLVELGLKMKK
jgi:hypothetical protein